MLAQVERLGRLVQQLLDLSRLESGTLPLDRNLFDVRPMLEHAIRESQLHATDVHFDIEMVPRDFRLEADAERLHQVVANLVENAVRHSPPQGTVLVRAVAAPDGGARLEVTDDGPGIPDSEVTRVFERFYRADSARSSSDGGAGLGLAIARWIVELHGGDIRVTRNEPHGCRMIATIPGGVELSARCPLPNSSTEGRCRCHLPPSTTRCDASAAARWCSWSTTKTARTRATSRSRPSG